MWRLVKKVVWPKESLSVAWKADPLDSFPQPWVGRAPVMAFETNSEFSPESSHGPILNLAVVAEPNQAQ